MIIPFEFYADIFKLRMTGLYNFLNPGIIFIQRRIIDASLV